MEKHHYRFLKTEQQRMSVRKVTLGATKWQTNLWCSYNRFQPVWSHSVPNRLHDHRVLSIRLQRQSYCAFTLGGNDGLQRRPAIKAIWPFQPFDLDCMSKSVVSYALGKNVVRNRKSNRLNSFSGKAGFFVCRNSKYEYLKSKLMGSKHQCICNSIRTKWLYSC